MPMPMGGKVPDSIGRSLFIEPKEMEKWEEMLSIKGGYSIDYPKNEIVKTYVKEFPCDFEVDIEIHNNDPPFVRGVLYHPVEEDGEISLYEADEHIAYRLHGDFWFGHDGQGYRLTVRKNTLLNKFFTLLNRAEGWALVAVFLGVLAIFALWVFESFQ